MVQLYPLTIDEVWMKPSPDGMVFCSEEDGFGNFDLEITLAGEIQDDWFIDSVRMKIKIRGRDYYQELSGPFAETTKDWLYANLGDRLQQHVDCEWLPSEIGAYADYRRAMA